MRCMVGEGQTVKSTSRDDCPNLSTVHFLQTLLLLDSLTPMTSTSDTDSCTAAEPVQTLTPPPSPPLVEDDATTTETPPLTSAPAKKKKKKKSKKSNKAKDAPAPPPTPAPTIEENQPPPLYISRNKHWKYISSFHVRTPLCLEMEALSLTFHPGTMVTTPPRTPRVLARSEHGPGHALGT